MNKPIRCTTHFHACDCREYEFEQLKKENQEMRELIAESLNSVLVIRNLFNRDLITRQMNIQINELLHEMNYKFLKVKTKGISETPNSSKEGV